MTARKDNGLVYFYDAVFYYHVFVIPVSAVQAFLRNDGHYKGQFVLAATAFRHCEL